MQRRPARTLREPDVIGRPLLQWCDVAAAREFAVDHRSQPPLAELAGELRRPAFGSARRRVVDHAHELHRQRRAADAERRPPQRDRARHRRIGDFQNAQEIDAVGIERGAEIAILVEQQALPVVFRHLAHGDRLVVGVRHVVAERDLAFRVVDVALAIEARIERADETAAAIVDGRRQPTLGVVAQLVGEEIVPHHAAHRRHHVDQRAREQRVQDCEARQMPQRGEVGQHRHGEHDEPRRHEGEPHQQFQRTREVSHRRRHRGPDRATARRSRYARSLAFQRGRRGEEAWRRRGRRRPAARCRLQDKHSRSAKYYGGVSKSAPRLWRPYHVS